VISGAALDGGPSGSLSRRFGSAKASAAGRSRASIRQRRCARIGSSPFGDCGRSSWQPPSGGWHAHGVRSFVGCRTAAPSGADRTVTRLRVGHGNSRPRGSPRATLLSARPSPRRRKRSEASEPSGSCAAETPDLASQPAPSDHLRVARQRRLHQGFRQGPTIVPAPAQEPSGSRTVKNGPFERFAAARFAGAFGRRLVSGCIRSHGFTLVDPIRTFGPGPAAQVEGMVERGNSQRRARSVR
jgi:hypothetical protein